MTDAKIYTSMSISQKNNSSKKSLLQKRTLEKFFRRKNTSDIKIEINITSDKVTGNETERKKKIEIDDKKYPLKTFLKNHQKKILEKRPLVSFDLINKIKSKEKIPINLIWLLGDSLSDQGSMNERQFFGCLPIPGTGLNESALGRFSNTFALSDNLIQIIIQKQIIDYLKKQNLNSSLKKRFIDSEDIVLATIANKDGVIDSHHSAQSKLKQLQRFKTEQGITFFAGKPVSRNNAQGGATAASYPLKKTIHDIAKNPLQFLKNLKPFIARSIVTNLGSEVDKLLAALEKYALEQEKFFEKNPAELVKFLEKKSIDTKIIEKIKEKYAAELEKRFIQSPLDFLSFLTDADKNAILNTRKETYAASLEKFFEKNPDELVKRLRKKAAKQKRLPTDKNKKTFINKIKERYANKLEKHLAENPADLLKSLTDKDKQTIINRRKDKYAAGLVKFFEENPAELFKFLAKDTIEQKKPLSDEDKKKIRNKINQSILVSILIGANDLLTVVPKPTRTAALTACKAQLKEMERLYAGGIRKFYLIYPIHIDNTPLFHQQRTNEERYNARQVSDYYIKNFIEGIKKFASKHSDCLIVTYNPNTQIDKFLKNPEKYGFSRSKIWTPLIKDKKIKNNHEGVYPSEGHMFWDLEHPTEPLNYQMAWAEYDKLSSIFEFKTNINNISILEPEQAHIVNPFLKKYNEYIKKDRDTRHLCHTHIKNQINDQTTLTPEDIFKYAQVKFKNQKENDPLLPLKQKLFFKLNHRTSKKKKNYQFYAFKLFAQKTSIKLKHRLLKKKKKNKSKASTRTLRLFKFFNPFIQKENCVQKILKEDLHWIDNNNELIPKSDLDNYYDHERKEMQSRKLLQSTQQAPF